MAQHINIISFIFILSIITKVLSSNPSSLFDNDESIFPTGILAPSVALAEVAALDLGHKQVKQEKLPSLSDIKNPFRDKHGYYVLEEQGKVHVEAHSSSNHLEVFCYHGEPKSIQTYFKTVEVQLNISDDSKYRYYEARNVSQVRQIYATSSWFSFTPWKPTSFLLDLYSESCVGIETSEQYRVSLKLTLLDVWRVLACCCGVLLFTSAPTLAHNLLFHYMTGSLLGVMGSFLIIIILLARYIPKRSGALTFLLGGSGVFLYVLQLLHSNFVHLLNEYYPFVVGYICLTGLASFALVYWWGGVANPRSLRLLQWALQLLGLVAVYCSSQHKEASAAVVILLLLHHNVSPILFSPLKRLWQRRFPPTLNLLTEEQYHEQSNVVTAQALSDLRDYCKSPKCDAWRTMSRLRNPCRFVEFVEGNSHVEQDERLLHDSYATALTDDDDFTDDDDDQPHQPVFQNNASYRP